jgi:pimeloyl-ACP methyl ester carboxylesterase
MVRPTYVLVHGAFGGAWCWRDLTIEFDRRGVAWRTIDLASSHDVGDGTSDLENDAAMVAALANTLGPVVLVGHSYGGAVISDAASRVADLLGLVYIAALVADPGHSASDTAREVLVRTELDDAMVVDGPFLRLDPAKAASALFAESSMETQAWAIDHLGRQTRASFRASRQWPDSTVPRLYILCRQDRAIDPSLQALMAAKCDAVAELNSDHSPYLSHPFVLSDLICNWPSGA